VQFVDTLGMKALLESSTDTAQHLVFDPEALFHLTQSDYSKWIQRIETEVRDHGAVLFLTGADGTCQILVCVDEPPDVEITAHAVGRQLGQIDVPSGTLAAGGPELLARRTPPSTADEIVRQPAALPATRLERGVYRCEAFILQDDFVSARLEERQDQVRERMRAKFPRAVYAYMARNFLRSILFAVTFIAVLLAGIFFFTNRWAGKELVREYLWWIPYRLGPSHRPRLAARGARDPTDGRRSGGRGIKGASRPRTLPLPNIGSESN
jgi:hypothetical protein